MSASKNGKIAGIVVCNPKVTVEMWTLSIHVITSKFSEILGSPSYYMHYGTFLQQLRKVKGLEYFEHNN